MQLAPPHGLGKTALYISTESPLQTSRLTQILKAHERLSQRSPDERPSLDRVQSTHIHDLEAQDHILRYQVPIAIRRHNVGLLVVDSIAANYRPEFDKGKARRSAAESFVKRSNQVSQLGALLRNIASTYKIAVVVANQVSDRFMPVEPSSQMPSQQTQRSRAASPPQQATHANGIISSTVSVEALAVPSLLSTDDPLSLDHQQCFFTGWGDDLSTSNMKTPSLGLTWTNQLVTRVALLKAPVYEAKQHKPGEESIMSAWKRTFKVVFSALCPASSTEFEISEDGVRSTVEPNAGLL